MSTILVVILHRERNNRPIRYNGTSVFPRVVTTFGTVSVSVETISVEAGNDIMFGELRIGSSNSRSPIIYSTIDYDDKKEPRKLANEKRRNKKDDDKKEEADTSDASSPIPLASKTNVSEADPSTTTNSKDSNRNFVAAGGDDSSSTNDNKKKLEQICDRILADRSFSNECRRVTEELIRAFHWLPPVEVANTLVSLTLTRLSNYAPCVIAVAKAYLDCVADKAVVPVVLEWVSQCSELEAELRARPPRSHVEALLHYFLHDNLVTLRLPERDSTVIPDHVPGRFCPRAALLTRTSLKELLDDCITVVGAHFPGSIVTLQNTVDDLIKQMAQTTEEPENPQDPAYTTELEEPAEPEKPEKPEKPEDKELKEERLTSLKDVSWPKGYIVQNVTKSERSVELSLSSTSISISIMHDELCVSTENADTIVISPFLSELRRVLEEIRKPVSFTPLVFDCETFAVNKMALCTDMSVDYAGTLAPSGVPNSKRSVNVVYGLSGVGKTVFSCFTLPKILMKGANYTVCHSTFRAESCAPVEQHHRAYLTELSGSAPGVLQRLFALAALGRKEWDDAAKCTGWRAVCDEILHKKRGRALLARDNAAVKLVRNTLESELRKRGASEQWFNNDAPPNKYDGTIFLVFDEVSKSLDTAHAIVSARMAIYGDSWIRNHFQRLEIVLCGAGAEILSTYDTLAVATDPRSVCCVEIRGATDSFVKQALHFAVGPIVSPELTKEFATNALFLAIKSNMRLLSLLCSLLYSVFDALKVVSSDSTATRLVAAAVANSLGLTGFIEIATIMYTFLNGLSGCRAPQDIRTLDALLVEMLANVPGKPAKELRQVTLIPVPSLDKHAELMERAAKLGLVTRGASPTPAIAAVSTFAYNVSRTTTDGYALEVFAAAWASRLVRVQCGFTAPVTRLQCCLPWQDPRTAPRLEHIEALVAALRKDGALVMLNGPSAPGADLMIVQLRPRTANESLGKPAVPGHMSAEAHGALWPKDAPITITVASIKRTGAQVPPQLIGMGVIPLNRPETLHPSAAANLKKQQDSYQKLIEENLYRQAGPLFLALLGAIAIQEFSDEQAEGDSAAAALGVKHRALVRELFDEYCTSCRCPTTRNELVTLREKLTTLLGRGDTPQYVMVQVRLVYGNSGWNPGAENMPVGGVLEGEEFESWVHPACVRDYGLCPPSTFGSLGGLIEVAGE